MRFPADGLPLYIAFWSLTMGDPNASVEYA